MGFFDKLGEMAGNAIDKRREDFERESERCEYWDDNRLLREARRTSSFAKKAAYIKELQNRGYTSEDFK